MYKGVDGGGWAVVPWCMVWCLRGGTDDCGIVRSNPSLLCQWWYTTKASPSPTVYVVGK